MSIRRRLSVLAVSAVLWGCPSSEDPNTETEPVVEAAAIAVDGVVLMKRDDMTAALNLIDPTTGKASPFELPIQPRTDGTWALSPDGHSVATVEPNGSVLVSRIIIDEASDLPTFERVAYWEMVGETNIRFTFEPGVWAGAKAIYDANTGSSEPCEIRDSAELETATTRCGEVIRRSRALTADRQFGWDLTHLPSGTRLQPGVMQNELRPTEGVQMKLPDGRLAVLQSGINGKHVVTESGGFQLLYKVETSTTAPGLTDAYDVPQAFINRRWDNEPLWDLTTVLRPYMNRGDGRRFAPIGFLQTGEVLYGISSWTISDSSVAGESVFGVGEIKNALFENVVHSALVAVDADGEVRAFEWEFEPGGVLPNFSDPGNWDQLLPPHTHHGVVLLGEESWLQSGQSGQHWVGYLDGEKVEIPQAGVMSTDSEWMVLSVPHSDRPPTLCFRPVKARAERTCIPQPTVGEPVSIVAQGIRDTAAAPVVTALSVPAAWPGAEVTVFGARFGSSPGTVKLAGTAVSSADVLSWSDRVVTFRTPQEMPPSGIVTIENSAGESPARGAHLNRTELVQTPFSALNRGPHKVGQGLNVVDLGEVEFDPPNQSLIRLSADSRTGDDYVVSVLSSGVLRLTSGDVEADVHFDLEDRSADGTLWQPIDYLLDNELTETPTHFDHLAGDLIEVPGRRHPLMVGNWVVLKRVAPQGPGVAQNYGLPNQWRTHGEVTLARIGNSVSRLLGYGEPSLEEWGTPMFGDPRFALGTAAAGFDFAGDIVLEVGIQNDGLGTSALYRLRTDLGLTPGPEVLASATTGREDTVFVEPIAIERAGQTAFLVFERTFDTPQHSHLIASDGGLQQDIAPAPGLTLPYRTFATGAVAVIYSEDDASMMRLDADAAMPVWTTVPQPTDGGRITSTYHDPSDGSLYAIDSDGMVFRATQGSGWSDWAEFDLGVQTAADIKVTPRALGRMANGRWLLGADVSSPDGDPWALGTTVYLVGPEVP